MRSASRRASDSLMTRRPDGLIYGLDDEPRPLLLAALGLQHFMVVAPNLAIVVMICRAAGVDATTTEGVLSFSLIALAVATLLQGSRRFGSGYFIVICNSGFSLSPSLAALYRLPTTGGWVPYEFPADSPRMGMLTQISFLAGHSHPGRSSATLRGKALRELLLCQPVPRPPANVDFSAVENPKANLRTARDRVNAHLENPVCAGCHKITDPMGLALENFDGAGRYRLTERGTTIDASGNLDGKAFTNVTGLATALRDHPALTSCVVKRAYAYGTGGPPSAVDRATLESRDKQFAANG